MDKVDPHFHLWDLQANYYPWLSDQVQPRVIGDYEAIRRNYLVSDFLADVADSSVVKGVHIQAEHDPNDPVRETRWLQQVADHPASRGFPHGIVAFADLTSESAPRVLEGHCAFPNMRGVRQLLMQHKVDPRARNPLESPLFIDNLALLARLDLSFDLQLFPQDMAAGAALIEAQPGIDFILTHTGLPMSDEAQHLAVWRAGMKQLAGFPNVSVKISGFGFFDRRWTEESIRPRVLETIDIFGTDRCMFASNFPVDGMARRYVDYWSAFDRITAAFSESERGQLFCGNAERIYRI